MSAIELNFSPNDTSKIERHSIHNQPNTRGQTQTGKLTKQWELIDISCLPYDDQFLTCLNVTAYDYFCTTQ